MPSTITIDPDAVLDLAFDWTDWLGATETISSYTADVTGVTEDSISEALGVVTVWVSAAVAGIAYVTCHIVTDQGREDDRTMTLRVVER